MFECNRRKPAARYATTERKLKVDSDQKEFCPRDGLMDCCFPFADKDRSKQRFRDTIRALLVYEGTESEFSAQKSYVNMDSVGFLANRDARRLIEQE